MLTHSTESSVAKAYNNYVAIKITCMAGADLSDCALEMHSGLCRKEKEKEGEFH